MYTKTIAVGTSASGGHLNFKTQETKRAKYEPMKCKFLLIIQGAPECQLDGQLTLYSGNNSQCVSTLGKHTR